MAGGETSTVHKERIIISEGVTSNQEPQWIRRNFGRNGGDDPGLPPPKRQYAGYSAVGCGGSTERFQWRGKHLQVRNCLLVRACPQKRLIFEAVECSPEEGEKVKGSAFIRRRDMGGGGVQRKLLEKQESPTSGKGKSLSD